MRPRTLGYPKKHEEMKTINDKREAFGSRKTSRQQAGGPHALLVDRRNRHGYRVPALCAAGSAGDVRGAGRGHCVVARGGTALVSGRRRAGGAGGGHGSVRVGGGGGGGAAVGRLGVIEGIRRADVGSGVALLDLAVKGAAAALLAVAAAGAAVDGDGDPEEGGDLCGAPEDRAPAGLAGLFALWVFGPVVHEGDDEEKKHQAQHEDEDEGPQWEVASIGGPEPAAAAAAADEDEGARPAGRGSADGRRSLVGGGGAGRAGRRAGGRVSLS